MFSRLLILGCMMAFGVAFIINMGAAMGLLPTKGMPMPFVSYGGSALIGDLLKNGVSIDARPPEQQSLLMQIFVSSFPILLLIGAWVFFMRQMQGGPGGRGALSFGKSRARLLGEDQVNVNFNDVAGVEEAKEEVGELVDFVHRVLEDKEKSHENTR